MAELAKIQRVTSVYSQAEDRFRLTGEVSPDDTRCFWLTQRLLRRLLPHLLDWLGEIAKAEGGEGKQDFGQAEIMQDFAQQAAKARLEPQTAVPVPAMPAADAPWAVEWLDALTKVGRFEMTVMMLDKKSRASLVAMFDRLAEAHAGPALVKLRKAYLGKE